MQVLTRVFSTVVALAISFIKCRYNFSVADSSALTDEMLEKLIASRNANTGVFNLRQVRKQSLDFNLRCFHVSWKANPLHSSFSRSEVSSLYSACRTLPSRKYR